MKAEESEHKSRLVQIEIYIVLLLVRPHFLKIYPLNYYSLNDKNVFYLFH